jgi:glycosyltransferase involved in cell wall biosynthesis
MWARSSTRFDSDGSGRQYDWSLILPESDRACVVLVASGLRDIGGHNYTYTRSVERELQARGFSVVVLAHRDLSKATLSETGYRPVFSKGRYDFPAGRTPLHALVNLWQQARVYANELRGALREIRPRSPELVFCHTLSDFELVGWAHCLKVAAVSPSLVLMLRETPGFKGMGFYRRWLHPYTGLRARALARISRRMHGGFVLATDTEELAADFSAIFRGRLKTFPIPVESSGQHLGSNRHSTKLVFGYVGDCRPGKGFPRLAPMIERVMTLDREDKIRFVVQMYRGTYDARQTPPGWEELEVLANRVPQRLELVRGVQGASDFDQLFASLDAVLIPNDHPAFKAGSSNVFCESAAFGKPVVVAEGTWMAGQLARYSGGVTFSLDDAKSFALSVLGLAERWQETSGRARSFSSVWRGEHNPKTLVDALLSS